MNGIDGQADERLPPNEGGAVPRHFGVGGASGGSIGEVLRGARERIGMSMAEVARRAGCARSYVSMLEAGTRGEEAGEELLGRLERAVGLRPGALVEWARWKATPESVRRRVEELERGGVAAGVRGLGGGLGVDGMRGVGGASALDAAWRSGKLAALVGGRVSNEQSGTRSVAGARPWVREVPLVNSVAAGVPTEFTDLGYPARVADEYVKAVGVEDEDAFAARVVGDSMAPEYREGDVVVFSPLAEVRDGADCYVRLEPDQETTFKRVFFVGDRGQVLADRERGEGSEELGVGSREGQSVEAVWSRFTHVRLVALNEKYGERVVEREMVAGLYAAVSVMRRVGSGRS